MSTVVKFSRIAVLFITIVGCVGCDQMTKVAARTYLSSGMTTSLFGDSLRFQYAENPGAFLSLGDQLPPGMRMALFTFGGALLVSAALVWAIR